MPEDNLSGARLLGAPDALLSVTAAAAGILRRIVRGAGIAVPPFATTVLGAGPSTAATIRAVRPFTMTTPRRIAALCEAVRYLVRSGIDGDVVECGVWRGGSMMAAAATFLQEGAADRQLHLFDTFEGMTAPGEVDVAIADGRPAAELLRESDRLDPNSVWCCAPLEGVKAAMAGTGYPMANVHCVRGPVEETVPRHAPARIALLRLDTDWYQSTRHELEHLFPRLVPGGVLIIDDYGHWDGARKAVDEFLARLPAPLPALHRIDYSGRCLIKP